MLNRGGNHIPSWLVFLSGLLQKLLSLSLSLSLSQQNMGMEGRTEIVFFDLETTIPFRNGGKHALLEFGAILVCPRKLKELDSYSSLVRPADLSSVSSASVKCNGITREAVASAPTFDQIADIVYDILHGRVWAGHNILKFDCVRIREAFAEIGRPAPEPKGTIDSLTLLTQKFGRRAGDMKMATLATYFGLGQQKHRSLDDVRMNLEVVKHCATVLFLESSLPDILINDFASPKPAARSRTNGNLSPEGTGPNSNNPSLPMLGNQGVPSPSLPTEPNILVATRTDPLDMAPLIDRMKIDHPNPSIAEVAIADLTEAFSNNASVSEGCSGYSGFLEPDEVFLSSISTCIVPSYPGCQKTQLLHRDVPLLLCCMKMRVRFGVSSKYLDHAGRPRLSIVLEPSPSLCQVLDMCDQLARRSSKESGSSSEWRPVVNRKNDFLNSPTIRMNIPTVANGDTVISSTEMHQKELLSGTTHKLVFSKFDAMELNSMFTQGTFVDAYFCLDVYDYQGNAGIRLVAKRLVVDSK